MFRTLDKLHSHSKWIYINKEADTWMRTWKTMRGRWGNKGPAKTSVSKGTEEPYNGSRGQVVMLRAGEREGCKVVNERGFGGVLRLYKVGSEGLTEVLWSTECDQYSTGFPHYWNRPHCVCHTIDWWIKLCLFAIHGFGFDHVFLDLFSTTEKKTRIFVYVLLFKLERKRNSKDMLITDRREKKTIIHSHTCLVCPSFSRLTLSVWGAARLCEAERTKTAS